MSRGFKLTLATIALVAGVLQTLGSGFGCAFTDHFNCLLATSVGPLTLIFYIILFLTNSDIFFFLSLLPFYYIILGAIGFLK